MPASHRRVDRQAPRLRTTASQPFPASTQVSALVSCAGPVGAPTLPIQRPHRLVRCTRHPHPRQARCQPDDTPAPRAQHLGNQALRRQDRNATPNPPRARTTSGLDAFTLPSRKQGSGGTANDKRACRPRDLRNRRRSALL